jgi:5-methylcytosine-specific restriction enzyme subunit McrC
MITTEIPIKNYFYLLSYAWNLLTEKDLIKVQLDDCETLDDLFARILISGTSLLVKKGVRKDYELHQEDLSFIRGKISIQDSINLILSNQNKLSCQFDELTYDILENRIIFQTLRNLLSSSIDKDAKSSIIKILRLCGGISSTEIRKSDFKNLRRERCGLRALLINVCEIIYDSKLPLNEHGGRIFRDFINDERELGRLFEAFVYNFYKNKLTGSKVSRDDISWGLVSSDEVSRSYLPRMRTDVVISSGNKKAIIDTKFYKETFQQFHSKQSIHSGNLYQIQSYVLHDSILSPDIERVGVLLYPVINPTPKLKYQLNPNNMIQVRTIDLSKDWQEIERDLLDMYAEFAA